MLYTGTSCFIVAKVVVFGQSGCILAEVVVFGQSGCIRAKRLYSVKLVVFGQKWLHSSESRCNWKKVVVFLQSG